MDAGELAFTQGALDLAAAQRDELSELLAAKERLLERVRLRIIEQLPPTHRRLPPLAGVSALVDVLRENHRELGAARGNQLAMAGQMRLKERDRGEAFLRVNAAQIAAANADIRAELAERTRDEALIAMKAAKTQAAEAEQRAQAAERGTARDFGKVEAMQQQRDEAYTQLNKYRVQAAESDRRACVAARRSASDALKLELIQQQIDALLRRAKAWPCVCGCPITEHDGGRAARGICMTCASIETRPVCSGFRVAPFKVMIPAGRP